MRGRAQEQLAAFWKNAQLVVCICGYLDRWLKVHSFPCVLDLAAKLVEQGLGELLRTRLGLRSLDTFVVDGHGGIVPT